MPWKRELYPPTWPEIRARILARAGNRCEKCGLPQYAVGYRDEDGRFWPNAGNLVCDASGVGQHPNGEPLTYAEALEFTEQYNDHWEGKRRVDWEGNHWIVIVLTIARLDPDGPLDCPDDRLKALCCRCHNRLDLPMHRRNARQTRERQVGVIFSPIGRHSAKPDAQYSFAEGYGGPYLEMFARPDDGLFPPRPGWTFIGNQATGRDIADDLRLLAETEK